MKTVNLTRNDSAKGVDDNHTLFSKKLGRVANLGDLMEEPIHHPSGKIVHVYFKLYVVKTFWTDCSLI